MQKSSKTYLSWGDIKNLLSPFDQPGVYIYGVPKGGMIAAGLCHAATVVYDPAGATLIIDDLIDSGSTRKKYAEKFPHIRFEALINKLDPNCPYRDQWIVFPWEAEHPGGEDSIQENITRIIQYIGDDPNRAGILETPDRVIKSYSELFSGYKADVKSIFKIFEEPADEIVLLRDIEFYSMCEHHMLPFVGKAHVAYIPKNNRVIGISKLARLVEVYARRLQIQERIGQQVTAALNEYLGVKGAACIIESKHYCMCMRGVNKQNPTMTTSTLTGVFRDDTNDARKELMFLLNR